MVFCSPKISAFPLKTLEKSHNDCWWYTISDWQMHTRTNSPASIGCIVRVCACDCHHNKIFWPIECDNSIYCIALKLIAFHIQQRWVVRNRINSLLRYTHTHTLYIYVYAFYKYPIKATTMGALLPTNQPVGAWECDSFSRPINNKANVLLFSNFMWNEMSSCKRLKVLYWCTN